MKCTQNYFHCAQLAFSILLSIIILIACLCSQCSRSPFIPVKLLNHIWSYYNLNPSRFSVYLISPKSYHLPDSFFSLQFRAVNLAFVSPPLNEISAPLLNRLLHSITVVAFRPGELYNAIKEDDQTLSQQTFCNGDGSQFLRRDRR
jgi:hypothetical protein